MRIVYGQDLIDELRKKADNIKKRLWIAVPYIGGLKSIQRILGRRWIDDQSLSIRLLTDTNEANNFNAETIRLFDSRGVIRNLSGLHAKIYIIDNECLITSANLTNTAFTKRHEIAIFLDETQSKDAISMFEKWWKVSEETSLDKLEAAFRRKNKSPEEVAGSKLPSLWTLPALPIEKTYWLKPIGSTENPIKENQLFNDTEYNLHFASKPTGVRLGDFFIVYGVGVKRILSIYESVSLFAKMTDSEIKKAPRMKRWPWYIRAKNLTPKFGQNWTNHNLYAEDLIKEYLKQNPDGFITKSGKTSGALNWGHDKFRLDPAFAKFVLLKCKMRILLTTTY